MGAADQYSERGVPVPAASSTAAIGHVCNCPNCSLRKDPVGARGAYKEHLKPIFIEAFKKTGTIYAGAQVAGVSETTIATWRESDAEFNREFMEADAQAGGRIETSAYQRAVNGTVHYRMKNGEPVLDKSGNPVISHREFSDALQIFFLKCRIPQRYQERVKQELDIRIVHTLASETMAIIRKHVPDFCPHCKTALAIAPKLSEAMAAIAARLAPTSTREAA